jgi:asparagine synthase (glutamine-hydrolysing)
VEVICTDAALREAFHALQADSAEPISDPAVLPTWLLARAANARVRVVLTGEGADELFGGYPTYVGHRLIPAWRTLPPAVRRFIARGIARLPGSDRKVPLQMLLQRFVAGAELDWATRHVEWMGAGLPEAPLPPNHRRCDTWLMAWLSSLNALPPLPAAMLLDYCTYLRERLLVKTDRALMLHSVEGRMPFLDRELTAFALALPPGDRLRGFTTKWLLKEAAQAWLPADVIHRRKRGLSVPVAGLIQGALREDCERLLGRESPVSTPLFDGFRVRRLLAEHLQGLANHARQLWPALALAAWAERWQAVLPARATPPAGRHPDPTTSL